jgi:hypothetical protein
MSIPPETRWRRSGLRYEGTVPPVTAIVDTAEEAAALELEPLLVRRPLEAFLDACGLGAVTRRPGFPSRQQLIERYEQRSGRSMSDVRWYMTLALWKSAVFLEGSYKRRLAGRTEDAFFDRLKTGVPAIAERAWRIATG